MSRPSGQYFPSVPALCCNVGLPESALWYDPKYVFDFGPSRQEALSCYLAKANLAAGDRLVGTMIHAGIIVHTLTVINHHGCAGWRYHFELHDVNALVVEANGGAASTPEVTFGAIDGTVTTQRAYDVRSTNSGNVYFGNPLGTITVNGQPQCCALHKALVLVIDALPDANATPTSTCPRPPCNYGPVDCAGANPLRCVDLTASVHVYVPNGVRNT
jgi:hypothetical protein